jgi:ABC-type transporter Mla maintaining outer membrane lipid asymmetry ATPase subunit MlaF
MDTVKYTTTAYAVVTKRGEVTVKEEGDKFCLSNTKILMLREGRVIFSDTNEEFVQSEDPYIQKFVSGTEMEPEQMTKLIHSWTWLEVLLPSNFDG